MEKDDVQAAREEWLRLMLDSASTDEQCRAARAALKRAIEAERKKMAAHAASKDQAKVPKS